MLSLDITFLNRDFAPVHLQLRLGTYSQARSRVPSKDSIKEFIIRKLNTLVVVDIRFISALNVFEAILSIQRFSILPNTEKFWRNIFTTHYACWNADLNLTLVTRTTNGLIFQIIPSLIECCEVRLTCLDCKVRN